MPVRLATGWKCGWFLNNWVITCPDRTFTGMNSVGLPTGWALYDRADGRFEYGVPFLAAFCRLFTAVAADAL